MGVEWASPQGTSPATAMTGFLPDRFHRQQPALIRREQALRSETCCRSGRLQNLSLSDCGLRKVYVNARGGWDGHAGSIRIHPQWHPELTSAEERKRQFEIEFRDFFR